MTSTASTLSNGHDGLRRSAVPIALAAALFAGVFLWAATWTGPEQGAALVDAAYVLATSLPWTLLWLAAAAGLGIIARAALRKWITIDGVQQISVGIALLLILDAALGTLGVMQLGGTSIVAWVFTVAAIAPLAVVLFRGRRRGLRLFCATPWMFVAAAPAVAVLILAASSAPGWLWASEFGGYDALSYHLQLPREWFDAGRIVPVEHNVYSFLPGFMEAAFYHVMVLRGDPLRALYACQLLHAGIAIIAALACARVLRILLNGAGYDETRTFAAAIVLGTPWVVVIGSLAYNEMPTVLKLAAGLSIILDPRRATAVGRAIIVGILIAAAVSVKPTAVGFVAVPLVVVSLWGDQKRITTLVTISIVSLVAVSPWLIRNAVHGGNPVFPFLGNVFGTGHFTDQQMAIWNAGHRSDLSLGDRIVEAFNQLFRYGLGANPDTTGHEPWQPQWSVLPWLALAGCALGTTAPKLRRPALLMLVIIVIQLAFWILFTHIKSRFMVAMVVPAALLTAIGMLRVLQLLRFAPDGCWRFGRIIVIVSALGYCLQPLLLYRVQQQNRPSARIGWVDLITGEALSPAQREDLADDVPSVLINYGLPKDARVLLIGDAAPLYYRGDITYTTTWDRGVMSRVLAQHPSDPQAWVKSLSAQGYTHVLLQPTMLALWKSEGWADPALDPKAIQAAFEQYATVIARFRDGAVLYKLP